MCEQYIHTLIPVPNGYVPSPREIQAFIAEMIDLAVIPGPTLIDLGTPSATRRQWRNVYTGETGYYQGVDHCKLTGQTEIERACATLSDYSITASGMGIPKLAPVPVEFESPYSVEVTCRVSSVFCSTSNYVDEDSPPFSTPTYGRPIDKPVSSGLFTNPHDGSHFEIQDAGSARFWIEFTLGKFLFPEIIDGRVDFLHPTIVSAAERLFETSFVQGCSFY